MHYLLGLYTQQKNIAEVSASLKILKIERYLSMFHSGERFPITSSQLLWKLNLWSIELISAPPKKKESTRKSNNYWLAANASLVLSGFVIWMAFLRLQCLEQKTEALISVTVSPSPLEPLAPFLEPDHVTRFQCCRGSRTPQKPVDWWMLERRCAFLKITWSEKEGRTCF